MRAVLTHINDLQTQARTGRLVRSRSTPTGELNASSRIVILHELIPLLTLDHPLFLLSNYSLIQRTGSQSKH